MAAGQALGRLLHLVQDRKHNWCSCGFRSNPKDSEDKCAAQEGGCQIPGFGNHAMRACSLRLEVINPLTHFQLKTDGDPNEKQKAQALQDSIAVLKEFLRLYEATKKKVGIAR